MIDNPDLPSASAALYLDLIERCLTNTVYGDGYTDVGAAPVWNGLSTPRFESLAAIGRGRPTR